MKMATRQGSDAVAGERLERHKIVALKRERDSDNGCRQQAEAESEVATNYKKSTLIRGGQTKWRPAKGKEKRKEKKV